MDTPALIQIGQSDAQAVPRAAQELHEALAQPDPELVMFFCSPEYDREQLAAELSARFDGAKLVGCTTAGEIGPAGFSDRSISGISFSSRCCVAAAGHFERLGMFDGGRATRLVQELLQRLESIDPRVEAPNTFGLLLIDGLSVREEQVSATLQSALGPVALIGGSAGDGLGFQNTYVYCDGAFRADSAALILISTPLPFAAFKTQHFTKTEQRIVVTGADPDRRIVTEIDGLPAAAEYAEVVGIDPLSLDPDRFAARPVMVVINGTEYVRSIQKVNRDGSMTFYCAIDEGLVLRAARSGDLVNDLARAFAELRAVVGEPLVVIGFDCILRKLEVVQTGLADQVRALLVANNVVGFNTYGEQYRGVHVNQTFTGIAIGRPGHA